LARANRPKYDRKDSYHQRAKREGYRSRAAYKLLELADRYALLSRGDRVVDFGCWPGGWMQVAAARVGAEGRVVGVDLAEIDPPLEIANTVAFTGDIAEPAVLQRILEELGGQAQWLLSDAAPKLTGIRATDRAREEALLEAIEAALPVVLAPGGGLLLKILEGPEAQAIDKRLRGRFAKARPAKPSASRKGTTERYLIAEGYQGGA
jgi:23S rRNA (uridine2552-2'-O)-methyltransferase